MIHSNTVDSRLYPNIKTDPPTAFRLTIKIMEARYNSSKTLGILFITQYIRNLSVTWKVLERSFVVTPGLNFVAMNKITKRGTNDDHHLFEFIHCNSNTYPR